MFTFRQVGKTLHIIHLELIIWIKKFYISAASLLVAVPGDNCSLQQSSETDRMTANREYYFSYVRRVYFDTSLLFRCAIRSTLDMSVECRVSREMALISFYASLSSYAQLLRGRHDATAQLSYNRNTKRYHWLLLGSWLSA